MDPRRKELRSIRRRLAGYLHEVQALRARCREIERELAEELGGGDLIVKGDLPKRAFERLQFAGVVTWQQLTRMTWDDLVGLRGISGPTAATIEFRLKKRGMALRAS